MQFFIFVTNKNQPNKPCDFPSYSFFEMVSQVLTLSFGLSSSILLFLLLTYAILFHQQSGFSPINYQPFLHKLDSYQLLWRLFFFFFTLPLVFSSLMEAFLYMYILTCISKSVVPIYSHLRRSLESFHISHPLQNFFLCSRRQPNYHTNIVEYQKWNLLEEETERERGNKPLRDRPWRRHVVSQDSQCPINCTISRGSHMNACACGGYDRYVKVLLDHPNNFPIGPGFSALWVLVCAELSHLGRPSRQSIVQICERCINTSLANKNLSKYFWATAIERTASIVQRGTVEMPDSFPYPNAYMVHVRNLYDRSGFQHESPNCCNFGV